MTGFSAYYLQNPFLFLLLFVKDEYIPAALYYIEALQLSFAGLTFQVFINKKFQKGNLIFSTAYALLGYAVGYFTLPIYFCNLIMLPLSVLGLYMIFEKKYKSGSLVYIISLALSVVFSYYLGYMLCIFLLLYAVYLVFISYKESSGSDTITKIKVFILSSGTAILLSLFTLLPTVLSLSGQKNAPGKSSLKFFRMYSIFNSFTALFTGSYTGNESNTGFPNIYIGVVPAFFVLCYLLNKKVKLKERIAALVFIIVMIISLNIHTLNVIWHAFNDPVGFGFRFAFLLSFLLLTVGYMGYLSEPEIKTYFISAAVILAYSAYGIVFHLFAQPVKYIIVDLIVIAVIISVKILKTGLHNSTPRNHTPRPLTALIAFVFIFEIALNAFTSLNINISSAKMLDEYNENYTRVKNLTDFIKNNDKSFYRIEKDFMINLEDAMAFDYNGLTHNSSCETDSVKQFMANMGFRNQGIWSFYNQGSTAFADMFLGVKYFISRFDSTDKPYETFANIGSDWIYKNNYALPIAFIANKDAIGNVNLDTHNYFEIQNEIAKSFYFDEDIYVPAQIESIKTDNLSCADMDLSAENLKTRFLEMGGVLHEDAELEKINKDAPAYVEFLIKINEDNRNLYFFFDASKNQGGIRILVNDFDFDDYFTDWRFNIERAGQFKKDDTVSIKIALTGTDRLLLNNCYIYEEKIDALKNWSDAADYNGLKNVELNKITSSHLKGTINPPVPDMKDNAVILSIPYDSGWHVTVDGYKINTYKTLDALLALDLSPLVNSSASGAYKINMYFVPKGIIIGSVVSILTVFALIFVYTDKKRFFIKR